MAHVKGEKIWADAVRKAVKDYMDVEGDDGAVKKVRYINHLATTLCKNAAKGDIQAIKEIGDRLDGKAAQPLTGADGKGPVVIERVVREVLHEANGHDQDAPSLPLPH